jgi:phospholipid/cholesterol/gamma-HCH transport system substrate-binding protein
MSLEAKVGFFVFLGIMFLFLLTTQVNTFQQYGEKGYNIFAFVDDSTGLEINSKVKMNGVTIGWLEGVQLTNEFVVLKIFIKNKTFIPKDSQVVLVQESILGSKQVNIIRGNESTFLADGDYLKDYKSMASFEQTSDNIFKAADAFQQLTSDIRDILNEQRKQEIGEAITNLNVILVELKDIIQENKNTVHSALDNFENVSYKLNDSVNSINNKLPQIVDNLDQLLVHYKNLGKTLEGEAPDLISSVENLANELNKTISETKVPLNRTINSVDKFFVQGSDAVEKIDRVLNSLTQTEIQIGFGSNLHLYKDSTEVFSGMDITYLPNPATYYMLSILMGPDFRTNTENSLHDEGRVYFSAQYGKRYRNWLFRAGIIESAGGIGIDYFIKNDTMKFTTDLYDFNAVNDVRSKYANLKASFRYRLLDHIDLVTGISNIFNSESRTFFVGIGAFFIDDSFSNLIISTAGAGMGTGAL